jgi:hypothetical protein
MRNSVSDVESRLRVSDGGVLKGMYGLRGGMGKIE